MREYKITPNMIPGLPKTPYKDGVGAYRGVVAHCTDNPNHKGGDLPSNERNYEANNWQKAFAHYFVGVEKGQPVVLQVADVNYVAWAAGRIANQIFAHVEFCMYDDPATFQMAYDAYCWLLAKLLHDRNLGVSPAKADGTGTLWSHADVSKFLGGTDHQDPIVYLKNHGISWNQHVANVVAYYNWLRNTNKVIYRVLLDGVQVIALSSLQNAENYAKQQLALGKGKLAVIETNNGTIIQKIGG